MWKFLSIIIFMGMWWPQGALAQSPNDGGGAIDVEADETGYNFEPYEYDTETGTDFDENIDIISPSVISTFGSSALTLFTLFDGVGFLGIFVVLLLALAVLWRIYGFVVGERITTSAGDLPRQANPFGRGRRR